MCELFKCIRKQLEIDCMQENPENNGRIQNNGILLESTVTGCGQCMGNREFIWSGLIAKLCHHQDNYFIINYIATVCVAMCLKSVFTKMQILHNHSCELRMEVNAEFCYCYTYATESTFL